MKVLTGAGLKKTDQREGLRNVVSISVIQLSSAPFIKKIYYKASSVKYVALKLRFAEPLPYVTLFN